MSAQGIGENRTPPGFRISAFFLVALSLSIGWGIRGNFGHEYGAMIAGALAAMAGCLLSGREDWRRRVAYFGFFGALGWGFGGSISYMQVISYTHSGHWPSQLYGFAALFLIGFLWAGLGGMGTALSAVLERNRLTELFKPLCWVFVVWALLPTAGEALLEQWTSRMDPSAFRHESPLYWFDADWLQALTAVAALCLFDLWERRFSKLRWFFTCGIAGGLAGLGVHYLLHRFGFAESIAEMFVRPLGDTTQYSPNELLINWPQCLPVIAGRLGLGFGAMLGAILGITLYFAKFGKWRSGSSLLIHMGVGWLAAFILLPTLLDLRLTPPRGDDWAGVLGVYCGASLYLLRNGLASVFHASLVAGFFGGLGFSGSTWLKLMMVVPGNPALVQNENTLRTWAHWQSANWHSFLEQTYGLVNGLGIAMMLGLLAMRVKPLKDESTRRRWTHRFAVVFVTAGIVFLNMRKNVDVWLDSGAMPPVMKAPLFESLEFSTATWFHFFFLVVVAGFFVPFVLHRRRSVALVPETWLGKGQLLYLVLLWAMVVANSERALVQFTDARLLTEGTILVNAALATALVLCLPQEDQGFPAWPVDNYRPVIRRTLVAGLIGAVIVVLAETAVVHLVYGDRHAGHSGYLGQPQTRFGPSAEWRVRPLLRGEEHR